MAIVGGFDIHRRQVTFDYLDTVTGQVRRGRVEPACREALRAWLERFAGRGDVTFAVEGCTGTGPLRPGELLRVFAESRPPAAKSGCGRSADLPGSGQRPLNWHGQRCFGPLPFARQLPAYTGADLGFCVAGDGFEPS